MSRFKNKVVFITGASSGLGAATAALFAREGAKVFGIGREQEALAETKKTVQGVFEFALCDVADPQQCRDAITACVKKFGQLDVLINIAGKHTFRHTPDIQEKDWEEDLAVNLSGPFYLSQAALPYLLEKNGNIVNIASIAGLQGQPYSAGYCSAKHGLIGLTRAMAMEFMKKNIRINAICPGGMDTPQIKNIQPPEDCDFDLLMRSAAPRGFMLVDDVAQTIAFLASDAASAVHGAVYTVDAGKTVG